MRIKTISKIKNFKGKRVLVRVDFNVPLKNGKVANDYKIRRTLPTIVYLLQRGAKVILMSHLGRPSGYDKKCSLAPVCKHVEKLLGEKIPFVTIKKVEDIEVAREALAAMGEGTLAMIDNIRFIPGEESNDTKTAKALAVFGDIFVLDGFAVAHRAAASVSGVAKFLPSYGGLLLSQEVSVLSHIMQKPKKPLVVILGGVKVETKIPVLRNLLPKADHILVGGGIASTYWWATGTNVGSTLVGKEFKREIVKYCKSKRVVLPVDVVVGDAKGKNAKVMAVDKLKISDKRYAIYDVGPKTMQLFSSYIKNAQTLIWNGALGMFEVHPYEYGTYALAHLFAARSKGKAFGVSGGGETVEILDNLGVSSDVDFVSTGGGALLEFLGGKKLPGLRAIKKGFFN